MAGSRSTSTVQAAARGSSRCSPVPSSRGFRRSQVELASACRWATFSNAVVPFALTTRSGRWPGRGRRGAGLPGGAVVEFASRTRRHLGACAVDTPKSAGVDRVARRTPAATCAGHRRAQAHDQGRCTTARSVDHVQTPLAVAALRQVHSQCGRQSWHGHGLGARQRVQIDKAILPNWVGERTNTSGSGGHRRLLRSGAPESLSTAGCPTQQDHRGVQPPAARPLLPVA